MECFDHIELRPGGREEVIKSFSAEFPYLFVLSDHDRYSEKTVPWHWHQEIEMYYALSGEVECMTPHARAVVRPGDVAFVNANVLHSTRSVEGRPGAALHVHMFRPSFLAPEESLLARRFVEPLCRAGSVELVAYSDGDERSRRLRELMAAATDVALAENEGWELRIHALLCEAWAALAVLVKPLLAGGPAEMPTAQGERLKLMLDFIDLHYSERISVADIAEAGFTSVRECHRTFREVLRTTPANYLRDYRVEQACRMLSHTTRPVGSVAELSGFGTASLFARLFKESLGCTPSEYRRRWQK